MYNSAQATEALTLFHIASMFLWGTHWLQCLVFSQIFGVEIGGEERLINQNEIKRSNLNEIRGVKSYYI